jgi:hypothetical protein
MIKEIFKHFPDSKPAHDYEKGLYEYPAVHQKYIHGYLEILKEISGEQKLFIKVTDAEAHKTYLQNKALHGIMQELFISGMHSSPAESFADFKEWVKAEVICLFEVYKFWHPKQKEFIKRNRVKSVANYSKKEMETAIKLLLAYVDNCGCFTKNMDKIRNKMEENSILRNLNSD